MLPKRGPKAFNAFIDSLLHTSQTYIVNMIAPNIDISEYTPSSGPTVVPPGGKGDSLSPNPSSIPQPVSIASKSGSKGQMGTPQPMSLPTKSSEQGNKGGNTIISTLTVTGPPSIGELVDYDLYS